jgi:hypothetical protein
MLRTFLMTVLAVVAIGFGVGSTAEAGDSGTFIGGGYIRPYTGSKRQAGVTVLNNSSDRLPVYVIWVPSGSTVNPLNLSLAELLANGARPVVPEFIFGTTIPELAPGDGVLWAFDGVGGSFGFLPATLHVGPDSNYFKITGPSTAPVVTAL